ncbi:MAG: hypothetical protein M0002_15970 [Rhodospirillales bacterium]|nr:hypothetical protein [Rhodospirillales bacterium]
MNSVRRCQPDRKAGLHARHDEVVTLAELRHGIERLPARFEARMLPVDAETANAWGGA